MNELIQKMYKDAEEYGGLHGENCSCMMESPDECDCDEMQAIQYFTAEWMEKVNQYWIEMAKEHRKLCTPEGKKHLTKMITGKLANPL